MMKCNICKREMPDSVMDHQGMSLRDYFAAHAMVGFMPLTHNFPYTCEEWSRKCYDVADAMLAERDRRNS